MKNFEARRLTGLLLLQAIWSICACGSISGSQLDNPFCDSKTKEFSPPENLIFVGSDGPYEVSVATYLGATGELRVRVMGDLGPPFWVGGPLDSNGCFTLQFGELGGTDCPIDGFLVHGRFVSATEVQVLWRPITACRFTEGDPIQLTAEARAGFIEVPLP